MPNNFIGLHATRQGNPITIAAGNGIAISTVPYISTLLKANMQYG